MENRATSPRAASASSVPEAEPDDVRASQGYLPGHINVVPGGVSGQPDGVVTLVCFRADQMIRERSSHRTRPILRGTRWPGAGGDRIAIGSRAEPPLAGGR